ncbi:MAG TPA: NAD(P)H-dependent glycerol-3-phosphate dehydrogenase [Dehalococcoidia bacterium]
MVGATTWGTTLAFLLARNGHDVRLLCRTADEASTVQASRRVHRATVLELPESVQPTDDAGGAFEAVSAVVIAVPSQTIRQNARLVRAALSPRSVVVHATKGLEHGTAKRVSEMLLEELPQLTGADVCVLSGPNLATEIQRGLPATSVVAGADGATVERVRSLFHRPSFRVYVSSDIAGVELAGSLKNVVAIAAGIADGLGVGDNAKAGIITRGLAEITRLGVACGADAATFAGLAGAGDVMATCYSPLSRNRRAGEAIGRGEAVESAVSGAGGVVEGAEATAAACVLAARHGVEMPIAEALRRVLFEAVTPADAIRSLLEREATSESS